MSGKLSKCLYIHSYTHLITSSALNECRYLSASSGFRLLGEIPAGAILAKFLAKIHFFNLNDSSLGRHVNAVVTQKLRNSSVLYFKTKKPFETKICLKISFQLLYNTP